MINIAQIGCGYWGPNLLRSFNNSPGCRVKWMVEQSSDRLKYVGYNHPDVKLTSEVQTVLDDPEVDGVVVATPARTHFELARQVLRSGKHVFVEKPLATTVAEVDELTALAEEANRLIMVGHTFLYNPAVLYLKKMIDQGELGEVYYAYAQRLNLGVIRRDVNAMWNLAPHDVSILCYLFGANPTSVTAHGNSYIQPGIEDVVFMNLQFAQGVQASVQVSWLDPQKVRRVTVVGSRKMVIYDDMAEHKIAIYDKGIDATKTEEDKMPFDSVVPFKFIHRSGDLLMPSIAWQEPLKEEAKHFIESIEQGSVPRTGASHARDVISVLERAQKSLDKAEK